MKFPPPMAALDEHVNGMGAERTASSEVGQNIGLEETVQVLVKELKEI